MSQAPSPSTDRSSGLEIVLQWAQLPPEHLEIALKAIEPELAREHEWRMEQARLRVQDDKDRRLHALYLGGLVAGFLLAAGMLTGAVFVGVRGAPWLAALLSGPSLISLAGLFLLRRVDSGHTRESGRAQRVALSAMAAQQPAPADPATNSGVA
ncbi:hypothetical protein [Streptomyces sp. TLI_146]|uniref:hypothetical protein n=1 Tax=Streptomyces sp. TLI_146 TaxID=1938858 RepID=UPI000C6FE801|nr:hypothetical protein [Streptomyces sp. TLI_146]PKV90044.1 hypothetical protein BX283_7705 [Streptomyces sp. TLI_146]